MRPRPRGQGGATPDDRGTRDRGVSSVAAPGCRSTPPALLSASPQGDGRVPLADPAGTRLRPRCAAILSGRRESGPRRPAFPRTPFAATGRLPSSRTLQLVNFSNDQILLDAAKAIDEHGSVQVIHLVLKSP